MKTQINYLTRRLLAKACLVAVCSCALGQFGCQRDTRLAPDSGNTTQQTEVHSQAYPLEPRQSNTLTEANQATEDSGQPEKQITETSNSSNVRPIKHEPIDRTKPIVGENGLTYTPGQLHKNSSLLVLAFQPDIRADYVIMTTRELLNDEQSVQAKKLALTYEDQFTELERQRAAILGNASDLNDVDREILKVQMSLADLLRQIRSRINLEIMTHEQRVEAMKIHKAYLQAKAEKEEKERRKSEGG